MNFYHLLYLLVSTFLPVTVHFKWLRLRSLLIFFAVVVVVVFYIVMIFSFTLLTLMILFFSIQCSIYYFIYCYLHPWRQLCIFCFVYTYMQCIAHTTHSSFVFNVDESLVWNECIVRSFMWSKLFANKYIVFIHCMCVFSTLLWAWRFISNEVFFFFIFLYIRSNIT